MSLKQFYADPYYNIRSFAAQTLLSITLCIALYQILPASYYNFTFAWWEPIVYLVAGLYIGGLSAVWIHNATHKSFKNQKINQFCGYIAGLHQLWGFRGWSLIHLIHHQYSDHHEHDPHPPLGRSFTTFLRSMFIESSYTISKRYREHWGELPRTKLLQNLVHIAFYAAVISSTLFWYLLLGPVGFIFGYIPSLVWNHIFFAHINYYCHPKNEETGQTSATNLNHNLYYKTANAIWHGIYFHGNHHKKPLLFNPREMPVKVKQAESEMKEAA